MGIVTACRTCGQASVSACFTRVRFTIAAGGGTIIVARGVAPGRTTAISVGTVSLIGTSTPRVTGRTTPTTVDTLFVAILYLVVAAGSFLHDAIPLAAADLFSVAFYKGGAFAVGELRAARSE